MLMRPLSIRTSDSPEQSPRGTPPPRPTAEAFNDEDEMFNALPTPTKSRTSTPKGSKGQPTKHPQIAFGTSGATVEWKRLIL